MIICANLWFIHFTKYPVPHPHLLDVVFYDKNTPRDVVFYDKKMPKDVVFYDKVSAHRDFWVKGKDSSEIDFLYNHQSRLIPIEVKNGNNSHLRSLHTFIDLSPIDIGVRIWSQPFSVNDVTTTIGRKPFRLFNIPFYMVGNIDNILNRY